MGIVLVRAASAEVWNGQPGPDEARLDKMRATFALRGQEGISLWSVESDADRKLVVAAMMCTKVRLAPGKIRVESVRWIEIDQAYLEKFGSVTSRPDHADTSLSMARCLHVELAWTQAALDAFAEYLGSTVQLRATSYTRSDVKAALAGIDLQGIDDERVREWMADLRDP